MPGLARFDAVVIGAGPAGYLAALRLAQLGRSVAVVERERVGGECLNWGCIPSKALIEVADLVHRTKRLSQLGIEVEVRRISMPELIKWKDSIVAKLVRGIETLFDHYGVTLIRGEGRVKAGRKVEVLSGNGRSEVEAGSVLLAVGSVPVTIPQIPFDGRRVIGFREVLSLEEVPSRLLVVGGGAIGLEMAFAFRKLGSEVTVVELMDRVLPAMDPAVSRAVQRSLERLGVRTLLRSTVSSSEPRGSSVSVRIATPNGELTEDFDRVLVAVGKRAPELPVESSIGLELDQRGFVRVDEAMRTNVEWIWAAGDVTGPPFLAHRAYRQGLVAAESIAGRVTTWAPKSYPVAVFTDPEAASVGMTEEEASRSGRRFRSFVFPLAALGRAHTVGDAEGFVKVLLEEGTDELLGVHVVGPHASELISEASLAMENLMTPDDFLRGVRPHPTFSEALAEAVELALGRPLHVALRKGSS
ncbi:MAG: dihydrolipoyl dehydrogenase [Nitrososphaerota archaeon]